MFRRLYDLVCKPHVHLGTLLLRLGLAAIFIYHGYIKLAVQGGRGWDKNLPELTQMAVAWGETICGLALVLGFLSRLAALGIIVMQWGAITLYTGRYDFVNIEYKPSERIPTGSEYNFALIVMSLAVLVLGSGMFSVDYCLFRRRRKVSSERGASAP